MKALYEVTATKNRQIKTPQGYTTPPDSYVTYNCYQIASSPEHAIELAKLYIPPTTKYDHIQATFIRLD